VLALHLNYRRSLVVVKEKPLHVLLSWLQAGQLVKYKASEDSFRAAAFIGCIDKDDPTLFLNLKKHQPALLDADCARFARLEVTVPDLEKKLAAAQAAKKDLSGLQEKLLTLKAEKEEMEKARVAFPNPFILFCKLQGLIDGIQSKVDQKELDDYEAQMDAFKPLLQV